MRSNERLRSSSVSPRAFPGFLVRYADALYPGLAQPCFDPRGPEAAVADDGLGHTASQGRDLVDVGDGLIDVCGFSPTGFCMTMKPSDDSPTKTL